MNSGADDDVPSPAAASSCDSASKSPRRSKNKLDRWVLKLKADEQRKRDALDAATVPRDAARGGVANFLYNFNTCANFAVSTGYNFR